MVGYGLYVGLNNGFQFENAQTETPEWLHQEMQTENGIPQITPPQITEPTMPVKPGAANSVGNNVTPGDAIVAVPSAMVPSNESENPPPVTVPSASVPQARYPANPDAQSVPISNEQSISTAPQSSMVVPAGPAGVVTSPSTVSPSPSLSVPATKPTIAHLAVTLAAGQAVILAHLTAPVQHTRHTTNGEAYDHEEGREGRSVQRKSTYVLQDPTKS